MIGYLAQHALGRYDLPLPTGPVPVGDSRRRCAHAVLRRAQHRHVRGGVVAPARRPALLRRAPRDRARGGCDRCRGCAAGSSRLAVEYVSSYEIDPSAFEAEFGMIDPQDPEVARSA